MRLFTPYSWASLSKHAQSFSFTCVFFISRQRKPTISRKNLKKLQRKSAVPLSSWLPWSDTSRHCCTATQTRRFQGTPLSITSFSLGPLNCALGKENINILKFKYLNCIFHFFFLKLVPGATSVIQQELSIVTDPVFYLWQFSLYCFLDSAG